MNHPSEIKEKKRQRWIMAGAVGLVLLGAIFLVISGLRQDSVYFLNVSEAMTVGPEKLKQARLFGKVDASGLEMKASSLGVRFRLQDKDNAAETLWVEYEGAVPDTFKPGVEVIVEGSMDSLRSVFMASTLLTKCPSKYQRKDSGAS